MSATKPHAWKRISGTEYVCTNEGCIAKKKEVFNGQISERLYYVGSQIYVHAPQCKGVKEKVKRKTENKIITTQLNLYR